MTALAKSCAVVICMLVAVAHPLLAQRSTPRFPDYPAIEKYNGRNAPIALSRDDKAFRTRLRSAASHKPNFAGHYIVAAWGCGAECLTGAVIDANSGRVSWFPFTLCCWDVNVDRPIEYVLESRLIVFKGERNERPGDNGSHYYEVRDGRFIEIHRSQ